MIETKKVYIVDGGSFNTYNEARTAEAALKKRQLLASVTDVVDTYGGQGCDVNRLVEALFMFYDIKAKRSV